MEVAGTADVSGARTGWSPRRWADTAFFRKMPASPRAHLDTFGFVVLRDVTDTSALCAEFDVTMQEAFSDASPMISGSAGNEFHYVPMMSDRTPVSLGLVLRLSVLAAGVREGCACTECGSVC